MADGASFSAVHSGRYLAENFDRASLSAILQAHGYHAPYLEAFNDPAIGWLAARWLSYPLPWRALLEALTSDDRARAALAPFSRLIWLLDMITRDAPIEKSRGTRRFSAPTPRRTLAQTRRRRSCDPSAN